MTYGARNVTASVMVIRGPTQTGPEGSCCQEMYADRTGSLSLPTYSIDSSPPPFPPAICSKRLFSQWDFVWIMACPSLPAGRVSDSAPVGEWRVSFWPSVNLGLRAAA